MKGRKAMKKLMMAVLSVGALCASAYGGVIDVSGKDGKVVHVERNLTYGDRVNKTGTTGTGAASDFLGEGENYPAALDNLQNVLPYLDVYKNANAATKALLMYQAKQVASETTTLDNTKINAHATAQTYDIYYPQTIDANTKVVLHVHGGSWMLNGDAGLFLSNRLSPLVTPDEFLAYINNANVIVYSMNYQLLPNYYLAIGHTVDPTLPEFKLSATDPQPVPDATFDGMLSDIDKMVAKVKVDLEERFPDQASALENRFIIWGESAGAHLASLYAYDESNPGRLNLGLDHALTPRVLINMAGPVDLSSEASVAAWKACGNIGLQSADPDLGAAQVIGKLLANGKDEGLYSVDKLVTAGATPTVLDYNKLSTAGTSVPSDTVIPYQQYELLSAALADAGVPVRSQVNNLSHGLEYGTTLWALNAADELMNEGAAELTVVETDDGFEVSGNEAAVGRYVFRAWGGYGSGDRDDPRAWLHCDCIGKLTAGGSLSVTAKTGVQRFFLLASQSVCTRIASLSATITGSSGSYFETGYKPNANTEFFADFTTPPHTANNYSEVLVCARNSTATGMMNIHYVDKATPADRRLNIGYPYPGSWDTDKFDLAVDTHVLLTCKPGSAVLVNMSTGASTTHALGAGSFAGEPAYLLAMTSNGGQSFLNYCSMPVHELKFSESGVAKHDYVPVKADGKVTFLDLVTGEVLTAKGAAQFTAGAELGVAGLCAKSDLYTREAPPVVLKATLKVKIGDVVYTSETTERGGTLVFSNEDLAAALSGKEVKKSTFAFDEAAYLAEADGGAVDLDYMLNHLTYFPDKSGMLQSAEIPFGNWMLCFSNETYNAANDRYFNWTGTGPIYIPHWKGANLSYRATPEDGSRVLDLSQLLSGVFKAVKDAGVDVVDPFTMYVKGAEGDAKLPHVIKYWDRTQNPQVIFDPSEVLLTATCPKPTLGELADGKVSVEDFDPEGITHYLLTLEVGEPSGKWTEPTEDSPEAIAAALAKDGFGPAAQGAFQTLNEYNAFKDYCVNVLGLENPNDETRLGVKANALLGYALGSPVVPGDVLESDDVKITAMELQGSSSVQLTVTIEDFEPDDFEQVPFALQAAISAKGGESLADMSADQVSVNATVEDGALIVVVEPKESVDASFFVQMLIRE